ncbi:MAG: GNAT family N-acetyltransferase [Hyphomicrobiaceae bacterium]
MDFDEFAAQHYSALAGDEIRHNVLLAILRRRRADPDLHVRVWHFGQPGCCAVQQRGYGIVLAAAKREQVQSLAGDVAKEDIPSVMGPDDTATWFVEASADLGTDYPNMMAQTIHALDHQPRHPNCDGNARLATRDDIGLVLEWLTAFVDEAVPEDQEPTLEDVRQRIEKKRVYLWCVDERPVAMSCVGRQLEAGIAIAPVYTPPELRRRGYAGAATAEIVEQALRRGYRFACLFTDDSNPAATRCYANIGFRPYCKSNMYRK